MKMLFNGHTRAWEGGGGGGYVPAQRHTGTSPS